MNKLCPWTGQKCPHQEFPWKQDGKKPKHCEKDEIMTDEHIESLIACCSMRPQPETPQGKAWEDGARQGWKWAKIYEPSWQPIETAPRDGTLILVWAPGKYDLPPLYSLCAYHADAGFTIDELREPSHWMKLQEPPGG